MADCNQTVRIFISSPGDVTEERDGAKHVIEGLQRLYPNATLQAVLWEQLALPATASFQETIDYLLESEPIDIAVFILWSRLGSPLGPAITRPDGTPYRSGTEREFDLMLAAFEQSGRQRPVILAYVRDDKPAFLERFNESDATEWEELIRQRKLAQAFIREQFHDAEGRNLRAYQTYREPVGFLERLQGHLRLAIEDLLEVHSPVTWLEEPYRGLETFEIRHAPIFHGRDEETCDLLQRLRDQRRDGSAFLVIVGASGSGKSSLARAGVAARWIQQAGDGEATTWRVSSFIPALSEESLFHALVRSLAEALPGLIDSDDAANRIAKGLGENAPLTVELTIAPVFARSSPPVRLLLILDQMEELWTDRHTTSEDRERFLAAIEALTNSGHVAVLATLRSDFYHHAQASPAFLRLKGERGHYDLLPPDSASIHRLITEPARLSGLNFERNEQTGRSLDEVVLEDASRDPNALPLLEYTLSELYRQRDEERRLMAYAAYVDLGGVEGAIGKRADELFRSLPGEVQVAMEEILPLLVSVDAGSEQAAVRRRASVADLTSTPARKTLTEHLIAARFLTTDRQDEMPIASLAHEALLRRWDRIAGWVNANREKLRLRARVEQLQQRWEQQDRDESLLLAEGLPLDEGRQLLDGAPYLLTESTKDYIDASITQQERKTAQRRRVRRAVLSTIAALLLAIMGGGVASWRINQRSKAEGLVQRLIDVEASGLKDAIDDLAPYRDLAREGLVRAYEDSEDPSRAKLHAGLALVAQDDSLLPYLKERLLEVTPAQFSPVRDLLDIHKSDLIHDYWEIALSGESDQRRRFQAACALAGYDPENEHWQSDEFTGFVADYLVKENPLRLTIWIDALRPVRGHLSSPLEQVFRSSAEVRSQGEIDLATSILEDYAADDPGQLSRLLLEAEPKQLDALADEFAAYQHKAVELMQQILRGGGETDAEQASGDPVAYRQSRAATVLLRMGEVDPILELIQRDLEDPEAMTQFVHRCRDSGVQPSEIWQCLDQAAGERESTGGQSEARHKLDRAMYGMLLALGEFQLSDIPETERKVMTDKLIDWYAHHPSSAVHGATGWLLRQWGFEDEVLRIDQTPIPFDETNERDWYVIKVEPAPDKPKSGVAGLLGSLLGSNTNQRPDPIHFTMIVFPPGEFVMGSPKDEDEHQGDEAMRRILLTRPLAVSDREVTWAQFKPYDQSGHHDAWEKQFGRNLGPSNPVFGVNWFESVNYCRWLTSQVGLPESDMWYSATPLEDNTNSDPGWVDLPDSTQWQVNLNGQGFRLLTEAEWEYVCRSGTRSAYSFGNDRGVLGQYAWYLENSGDWSHAGCQLRPNPRGLFDIHGNVVEWCHDWYASDYSEEKDPIGPDSGSYRVSRGGSWSRTARYCRSSYRYWIVPSYRFNFLGFRVASVPSSQPSKPSQGEAESESEQSARVEAEP